MKVPKRPVSSRLTGLSSSDSINEDADGLRHALPKSHNHPLEGPLGALLNPSSFGDGKAGSAALPPSAVAEKPELLDLQSLSQQKIEEIDFRCLKPFRGNLRAPSVSTRLTLLFALARRVALSGRILRRGSFLDLVL